MQRRAERGGLHELARLPERIAHVVPRHPLDPRRESELGAGGQLRVDAARRPSDVQEPLARRAHVE
jgi:hypothetical protein